jgi:hypothetical protein
MKHRTDRQTEDRQTDRQTDRRTDRAARRMKHRTDKGTDAQAYVAASHLPPLQTDRPDRWCTPCQEDRQTVGLADGRTNGRWSVPAIVHTRSPISSATRAEQPAQAASRNAGCQYSLSVHSRVMHRAAMSSALPVAGQTIRRTCNHAKGMPAGSMAPWCKMGGRAGGQKERESLCCWTKHTDTADRVSLPQPRKPPCGLQLRTSNLSIFQSNWTQLVLSGM